MDSIKSVFLPQTVSSTSPNELVDAMPVNHHGGFVIHACPYTANVVQLIRDSMANCLSFVTQEELIVEAASTRLRLRPLSSSGFHLGINILLYHTCDTRSLDFWGLIAKKIASGSKEVDLFGARGGLGSARPVSGFQSPSGRARNYAASDPVERETSSKSTEKPTLMPTLLLGVHNIPEALQSWRWPRIASSSMKKNFEAANGTRPCSTGERKVSMQSVLKLCAAWNAPWVEIEHGQIYSARLILEELSKLVILASVRPNMQHISELSTMTPLRLHSDAAPSGLHFANDHVLFTDTAKNQVSKVFMGDKLRSMRPLAPGAIPLTNPTALCIHGDGSILVCDAGSNVIHRLGAPLSWWDERVISSIFAGNGMSGFKDGPYLSASFDDPSFISRAPDEDVYLVADTGNNAVRLLSNGMVSTISTGHINAPLSARFSQSYGVLVADTGNHLIRHIQGGLTVTLAGSGDLRYSDGPALRARFCHPSDAIEASKGAMFICDSGNGRIRMLFNQMVSTISYSEHIKFERPIHFALSPDGELFISDAASPRIIHMVVPDIESARARGTDQLALLNNPDAQLSSNRSSFLTNLIVHLCACGNLPAQTRTYLIHTLRSEKYFPVLASVFKTVRRKLFSDCRRPNGVESEALPHLDLLPSQTDSTASSSESPASTTAVSPSGSISPLSTTSAAQSTRLSSSLSPSSSPSLSGMPSRWKPGSAYFSTPPLDSLAIAPESASSPQLSSLSPTAPLPTLSEDEENGLRTTGRLAPPSHLNTSNSSLPAITSSSPPDTAWMESSTRRQTFAPSASNSSASSRFLHPAGPTQSLYPWESPIEPTLHSLLTHEDKSLLMPSFNWTAHESASNKPQFIVLQLRNVCEAAVKWELDNISLTHTEGPGDFIFNVSPLKGRIEPGGIGYVKILANIVNLTDLWHVVVIRATSVATEFSIPGLPFPLKSPPVISFIPLLTWCCLEGSTAPKAFQAALDSGLTVMLPMFGETIELQTRRPAPKQNNVARLRLPRRYWCIKPKHLFDQELVGMGTSASVYRAQLHGLTVAVKKWDIGAKDATPEDFKVELQAFMQFCHPKLLRFYGAYCSEEENEREKARRAAEEKTGGADKTTSGLVYIVTEFADRGTLHDWLLNSPVQERTWRRKLQMALDVAEGLNYLHSLSWIHRDVKGLNILLLANLGARLADFGSSSAVHKKQPQGIGSFHWMAPEVAASTTYSIQSDVFSFGMLLVELMIEAPPIRTTEQISLGLVEPTHLNIHRFIHPSFVSLIESCCKPVPADRICIDDAIVQLKQQLEGKEAFAAPAKLPLLPKQRPRSVRAPLSPAALALDYEAK